MEAASSSEEVGNWTHIHGDISWKAFSSTNTVAENSDFLTVRVHNFYREKLCG